MHRAFKLIALCRQNYIQLELVHAHEKTLHYSIIFNADQKKLCLKGIDILRKSMHAVLHVNYNSFLLKDTIFYYFVGTLQEKSFIWRHLVKYNLLNRRFATPKNWIYKKLIKQMYNIDSLVFYKDDCTTLVTYF